MKLPLHHEAVGSHWSLANGMPRWVTPSLPCTHHPEELRGTGSPGNWPLPQKNLGYAEQDEVTFPPVPAATAHAPCVAPASLSALSFSSLSCDWNLFSDLGLVASLRMVSPAQRKTQKWQLYSGLISDSSALKGEELLPCHNYWWEGAGFAELDGRRRVDIMATKLDLVNKANWFKWK